MVDPIHGMGAIDSLVHTVQALGWFPFGLELFHMEDKPTETFIIVASDHLIITLFRPDQIYLLLLGFFEQKIGLTDRK